MMQEKAKSTRLQESVKQLNDEKARTESLLYQMIPKSVADRLREGESHADTCQVRVLHFLPVLPNPVTHCLHHLLPPQTSAYCPYSLRKRQHSRQLPHIEFSQYKNSFINRCLFKFRRLIRLYIFVVFFSPCVRIVRLLCFFLTFSCLIFLIYCNSVRMSYCIKRLLYLT